MDSWADFVSRVLVEFLPEELLEDEDEDISHRYRLRPDACEVLMEVVEDFMLLQLERALLLAIETTNENDDEYSYPAVSRKHLDLQFRLQNRFACRGLSEFEEVANPVPTLPINWTEEHLTRANSLLDTEKRDRLVRFLSYKAGVVVLKNDAYDWAWMCFVHRITCLLLPACKTLVYRASFSYRSNKKRKISNWNEAYSVPPPSFYCCDVCRTWWHTPVPGQIEETARHQNGPLMKVYGAKYYYYNPGLCWNAYESSMTLADDYIVESSSDDDDTASDVISSVVSESSDASSCLDDLSAITANS
jgi:hypothetical protein